MLPLPKTYFIKTFGCSANSVDSNTIAGILESLGFEQSNNLQDCDVLVVNTCSVRQKSEDKVYGLAKKFKKTKIPFVIMAGCMVGSVSGDRQRYKFSELKKRTRWVDEYIGPSQISNIPNILFKNNLLDEWALQKFNFDQIKPLLSNSEHAFVNISYGCDNFCSFCVVPYARGKEVFRSEEEILCEVRDLVDRGVKSVTLCGQNVNSWGLDVAKKFKIRTGSRQKLPFTTLLKKIHDIEGLEKIEFLSSNPFDFTNDLVNILTLPKMSSSLHIAIQSGNNDILKAMNRGHTVEDFIHLVEKIRKVRSDIKLGTDIIVGFPNETRDQFMDTVALFKKVKFDVAYISMYSPRKGTLAERSTKDNISLKEKKWRHAYLTKIWKESKTYRC